MRALLLGGLRSIFRVRASALIDDTVLQQLINGCHLSEGLSSPFPLTLRLSQRLLGSCEVASRLLDRLASLFVCAHKLRHCGRTSLFHQLRVLHLELGNLGRHNGPRKSREGLLLVGAQHHLARLCLDGLKYDMRAVSDLARSLATLFHHDILRQCLKLTLIEMKLRLSLRLVELERVQIRGGRTPSLRELRQLSSKGSKLINDNLLSGGLPFGLRLCNALLLQLGRILDPPFRQALLATMLGLEPLLLCCPLLSFFLHPEGDDIVLLLPALLGLLLLKYALQRRCGQRSGTGGGTFPVTTAPASAPSHG
mmetsp:Transcript_68815/g.153576  ORF Transcript_68815/g.153576 Transcript_68815/m.153576 type:complete len:310 (-) Transcript_68815:24-953(-)